MALLAHDESQGSRPSSLLRAVGAAVLLVLGCGESSSDVQMATVELSPEEQSNLDVATRVVEQGIGQGDASVFAALVRPGYVEHDVYAGDGRVGLQLPAGGATPVTIHRKLADGDRVALHSTYGAGDGRRVAFDVFRLEGGQVVEHWEAQQAWVEPQATLSGNTLVDGATLVTDRELTEQNEQLVTEMVREIFVEGNYERLPDYIGDPYIQHNPRAENGLAGVQAFLAAVQAQGVAIGYTGSPLVVADGNFVLVGSEGYLGTRETYTVFYDLFRVAGGKLVEHWDVIQVIELGSCSAIEACPELRPF